MVLETAVLNVKKGCEQEFECDFKTASKYISAINGYVNHSLQKCINQENKYILLVNWETLEDHTEGFRKSDNMPFGKIIASLLRPIPCSRVLSTRI